MPTAQIQSLKTNDAPNPTAREVPTTLDWIVQARELGEIYPSPLCRDCLLISPRTNPREEAVE